MPEYIQYIEYTSLNSEASGFHEMSHLDINTLKYLDE